MDALTALTREQLITLVLAQSEQIAQLQQRVAELEKQLNPPPGGANAPPGTLPSWVKPNKAAKPRAERKKRAYGFVRPCSKQPDRVVEHAADACPDCGRKLTGGTLHHTREVIDLPPVKVLITQHRLLSRWCGVCNKRVLARPDLSAQVAGKSRIGIRLMSLIAYLRISARMPVETLQQLLMAHYGVEVSAGEIVRITARVAERGRRVAEELLARIRTSPVVNADETGWREEGKSGYLWSFSTADTRYYIRDPSRSSAVVRNVLGEEFDGILVTDFYSAYNGYEGLHQRCWVHLLRDMHDLKEKHPDQPSVEKFVTSVRQVFDHARDFTHQDAPTRRRQRLYYQQQLLQVARPFIGASLPQSTLAKRIQQFLPELFMFVEHPGVPADNNAAERAVRPLVIARKVSGGTRSKQGSDAMSVLHTLFATWKLRGHDPIECCRQLLQGTLCPDANPA